MKIPADTGFRSSKWEKENIRGFNQQKWRSWAIIKEYSEYSLIQPLSPQKSMVIGLGCCLCSLLYPLFVVLCDTFQHWTDNFHKYSRKLYGPCTASEELSNIPSGGKKVSSNYFTSGYVDCGIFCGIICRWR